MDADAQWREIQRMEDAANKMLRASDDEYAEALLARYDDFAERVKADLMMIANEASTDEGPTFSAFSQLNGHKKMLEVLSREIASLNRDTVNGLDQQLIDQYQLAYNTSAWALDQTTPASIDVNYAMPSDKAIRQFVSSEWNGAMFSQRIGVINDFMATDIQQAVVQAMMSGKSNKDLADDIDEIIGDGSGGTAYRAEMIARTETARASNMARQSFFDDNEEYIEDWYWMSRSLSSPRLCEDCAERSGKSYDEIAGEGKFEGNGIAEYQDNDELDPPIHPHCACSWMSKPKTFEQLLGKDYAQFDQPLPRMTYEQWATQYKVA